MKVLVLGASGLLGGHLFECLKGEPQFQVVGTCFQNRLNRRLAMLDVTDPAQVAGLLKSFPAHVAVWCLLSRDSERRLIDAGIPNLIGHLPAGARLVYVSTDAVFAEGRGGYSEQDRPAYASRIDPVSLYANAKLVGENLAARHERHLIVRTGPLYGQDICGNWDKRISRLIAGLSAGERLRFASNLYRTFVHVQDLALAIAELVRRDHQGTIHLGPAHKASYHAFYAAMARQLALDASLIDQETIDPTQRPIPPDTSLDTSLARRLLKATFRELPPGDEPGE